MEPDDDPLWKRILFNEFLIALLAIGGILFAAFWLATTPKP